ncbi:aspartate aminotransferase [Desulfuromusa kysingii]|uniref:Aspartate aminotransferase n=1 Tax=Desulfuromusa kysingii TaxID=37625 RepID=A0A1H4DQ36_9BACT|nr:amino acid aminotransferase [Desulfuromusa kysingii]SEA74312.1 aspartate aminotransferase [Desulfuromusa kysingii]
MFEKVQIAPPDPILGLTETFKADPNPDKINLSVGVYQDSSGRTPVLETVKEAEKRILEQEDSKGYLSMTGAPVYCAVVQELLFGAGHEIIDSKRAATAQCPGGTGALRVAGDYLHFVHPGAKIWLSNPTWANHNTIFGAAGLTCEQYAYRNPETNGLDFDAMCESIKTIPKGDVILLHGCCHNPTGIDPTPEQWAIIGDLLAKQEVLPLVDFAYQGLANGIEEDRTGLLELVKKVKQMLICSSFSKNFGLYRERTGALTIVADDAQQANTVMSQVKLRIRYNYSNPPSHGGQIVAVVLSDKELKAKWYKEVAGIRSRINEMRHLFVKTLKEKGVKQDFNSIIEQRGMFSFSGLTKEQVARLRDEYSIYIVGSGRINVAGMTPSNMDRLCEAIKAVV